MNRSRRRVAVITGAAHGLGKAYAIRSAQAGLDIVVADVARCESTIAAIQQTGGRGLAVRCDVSSRDDVRRLLCSGGCAHGRGAGHQRVVNTHGQVMNGSLAYITSKSGIIGFTHALATEVGRVGVTVNVLMPGLTRTEATLEQAAAGRMAFEQMAALQPIRRTVEPSRRRISRTSSRSSLLTNRA